MTQEIWVDQIQPNRWSCLPTSFANMLRVDIKDIFEHIQHDGSQILWPDLPEPWNRRSFHLQEMVNFCMSENYSVTTVTPKLGIVSRDVCDVRLIDNEDKFNYYIDYYNGVLTGETSANLPHAVTWRGQRTIDPSTGKELDTVMGFSKFHIVQRVV